MPPKGLPKETVDRINKWRLYRDPKCKPLTRIEAGQYYRKNQYNEAQLPNPELPDAFIAPVPDLPPDALDGLEITPQRQEFLDRKIPALQNVFPDTQHVWRAIKFLGEGGNAMAGLWKYGDWNRHVVVKELLFTNSNPKVNDLREEGEIMQNLKGGPHIVKILADPTKVNPRDEGLNVNKWKNVVRRLLMEYCSMGSVEDLLTRRIKECVYSHVQPKRLLI